MKTQKTMSKLLASAAIALASVAPSYGQLNLGASCGCPPVNSRPTVTLSALPGFNAVANSNGGELTTGAALTCDKTYIIDQKIYIPSGQILSIQPGTVLKGVFTASVANASAIIIERGGKIIADGTKDCPIVFTAVADPMDGTYPISNISKWGGLVLLGKATNNLSFAANGPFVAGLGNGKLAVCDGVGIIEGFATSTPLDRHGVCTSANNQGSGEAINQTFDDNDNSGILRYVSVRYSGAILSVGSEINGISLGSVGRGTTLEHLEIVSCGDDGIEFFGGTVNVKYVTMLFGNDDMFDWDLGWSGKGQFLYGMKGDLTFNVDNDNGIEADADDQNSNNLPRSHPIIYNATIMGNTKTTGTSDNSALAAINAKALTEGEIYNSLFANFRNGLNLVKAFSAPRTMESWHNWAIAANGGNGSLSLKVKCNTFVNCANVLTTGAGNGAVVGTAGLPSDFVQFNTTDLNTTIVGNTLPGFDYNFSVNPATNVFSAKNDPIPNPALSVAGCPVPPTDGFFSPAPYRGAFSSTGDNWLSDWSYSAVIGTTKGVAACPTDLNKDGVTDVGDFLIFAPAYGTSCN